MTTNDIPIIIDRDERHPSIPDSNAASCTIDNNTLNNIINSIIQTSKTHEMNHLQQPTQEGTTQYLLPVDLLVSVDHKSNTPTLQAALLSSFALQLPATQFIPMNSSPASCISTSSTLNPAAPTFHPHTPHTSIQPILEQGTETFCVVEEDKDCDGVSWCLLDEENHNLDEKEAKAMHTSINTPPRFSYFYRNNNINDTRAYNKNWRNRDRGNTQQINSSLSWRKSFAKPSKPVKLMAEFVKHVTLPNRAEYLPNTIYTKTWAMRNCGNVEWGYNVELVYCKGDPHLSLYDRYPVINAQQGEEVEISATIKTSHVPKRYCTYFRLQKNGRFFGPRVWVDIIVGSLDQVKHCAAQENKVLPQKAGKWKKKYGKAVSCK